MNYLIKMCKITMALAVAMSIVCFGTTFSNDLGERTSQRLTSSQIINDMFGVRTVSAATKATSKAKPKTNKAQSKVQKPKATVKKSVKATTQKKSSVTVQKIEDAPEVSRGSVTAIKNDIIAKAKKYLGTPYLYGASGPSKFDCSGFTKYVYKDFGINLPRSSSQQSGTGVAINKNQLQQGDLVFFNTEQKGAINHVGIYVGDGRFIHASRTKGITITPLNDSYYKNKLSEIRRVVRS